ncbi:hypothetical protein JRG66_01710 [Salinimicrobium tongyeongense]|uniref:Uncharacterized protein n=1 Tax=Salinimicrobium tongyeongense TaxID=2809707 RepID=A0ABY6NRV3_9FLAO|nr:hypothetical protein [Salinimicrobium tongyeongense]UZH55637.1 hypothetical protein JRG66_01710 [Salinimicrobium tongyeongense]
MKFLVIAQDLKTSGTSEGIVSRSFLGKLRKIYPEAIIRVVYLRNMESENQLDLLPVNSIQEIQVRRSPPKFIKILNRIYWRVFNSSLNDQYLVSQYRHHIKRINWTEYDHIFIRSAGNNYETILACSGLPLLKNAVINFHDPYPQFLDPGSDHAPSKLEFNRQKRMRKIVLQAKTCITPSQSLSEDLEFFYGSRKKFYTLPHQFAPAVFANSAITKKNGNREKVVVTYQGAVQMGRNLDILLDAYLELLNRKGGFRDTTQFLLRITGPYSSELKEKYQHHPNLIVLEQIPFSRSVQEMKTETDIVIILENCRKRSNILPGKVPFIASLNKPFLCLSPKISELRRLIHEPAFVATCDDREEILQKLDHLITSVFQKKEFKEDPFRGYFNEKNFNNRLKVILKVGNSF